MALMPQRIDGAETALTRSSSRQSHLPSGRPVRPAGRGSGYFRVRVRITVTVRAMAMGMATGIGVWVELGLGFCLVGRLEEGGSSRARHVLRKVAADVRVDLEEGGSAVGLPSARTLWSCG